MEGRPHTISWAITPVTEQKCRPSTLCQIPTQQGVRPRFAHALQLRRNGNLTFNCLSGLCVCLSLYKVGARGEATVLPVKLSVVFVSGPARRHQEVASRTLSNRSARLLPALLHIFFKLDRCEISDGWIYQIPPGG